MKKHFFTGLILICFTGNFFAQENDLFVSDSLKHVNYIKDYIESLNKSDDNKIIYLSDFNFVSNDTYLIIKNKHSIKAKLISNKKIKKRFRSKNIRLTNLHKKQLSDLFLEENFNSLEGYKDCESVLNHFYYLNLFVKDRNFVLNSKCLPSLGKNQLVAPLIQLMDK